MVNAHDRVLPTCRRPQVPACHCPQTLTATQNSATLLASALSAGGGASAHAPAGFGGGSAAATAASLPPHPYCAPVLAGPADGGGLAPAGSGAAARQPPVDPAMQQAVMAWLLGRPGPWQVPHDEGAGPTHLNRCGSGQGCAFPRWGVGRACRGGMRRTCLRLALSPPPLQCAHPPPPHLARPGCLCGLADACGRQPDP